MMTTRLAANQIAYDTRDAYSFVRYGIGAWTELARLLLKHGLTTIEVEAVLRSKLTRFAADAQTNRYGHMSGRAAYAALVKWNELQADHIAELVAA